MWRKWAIVLVVLFLPVIVYSADYSQQQSWVDEETITHTKLNLDIGGIINVLNDLENENISATAAIAYGKLTLTDSIINADIGSSAAIAGSKLAEITQDDKVDFTALNVASEAQGDIMYFNGSAWVRLGYGTDGQFLKTQGSGANPAWANEAYTALGTAFGAWATDLEPAAGGGSATIVEDTVYLAATDGLVLARIAGEQNTNIQGYTDGSNPPTTIRIIDAVAAGAGEHSTCHITMPVRKGDYWKLTCTDTLDVIYWLPIGS